VEIKYADWSYSADPERDADEFRYKSRGYLGVFRFVVCDSGGYCLSPILDYECSRICGLHQLVIVSPGRPVHGKPRRSTSACCDSWMKGKITHCRWKADAIEADDLAV